MRLKYKTSNAGKNENLHEEFNASSHHGFEHWDSEFYNTGYPRYSWVMVHTNPENPEEKVVWEDIELWRLLRQFQQDDMAGKVGVRSYTHLTHYHNLYMPFWWASDDYLALMNINSSSERERCPVVWVKYLRKAVAVMHEMAMFGQWVYLGYELEWGLRMYEEGEISSIRLVTKDNFKDCQIGSKDYLLDAVKKLPTMEGWREVDRYYIHDMDEYKDTWNLQLVIAWRKDRIPDNLEEAMSTVKIGKKVSEFKFIRFESDAHPSDPKFVDITKYKRGSIKTLPYPKEG